MFKRLHLSKLFPAGAAMLIAVLVLATIMLSFAIVASTTARANLQSLTALQNKKIAEAAAVACLEHAINAVGLNNNYLGNETINVGSATCGVLTITGAGETRTIKTESQVMEQHARYQVVLSSLNPIKISSWEEIVSP